MLHDMAYGGTQGTSLFTNVSSDVLPISRNVLTYLVVDISVAISASTAQLQ
jgi:hypothetical protein